MNNGFNNMNDKEFLYQMCAFIGKENFIRFVNIASEECLDNRCEVGHYNCGDCFYKTLLEIKKEH